MKHHYRRFIPLLAMAIVVAATGCQGSAPGDGSITYVDKLDPVRKQLVADWNKLHPDQQVTLIEARATSDEIRNQLVQNFQAGSGQFDVVRVNNVWVPEFATRGWLAELDRSDFQLDQLFAPAVATGEHKGKLYAVPFFTDAGLLYYRKDLVPEPPRTFAELIEKCSAAKEHDLACYAGQYAQYDGLTVNVQEAIVAAGGAILDEDGMPTVNTPEAMQGLELLVGGFKQGWIPAEAITYHEEESRQAFQQGKLLFLRNWPYVYSLASADDSEVADKVGVALLPGIDGPGSSALGGWNLGVAANSKNKDAATAFIRYMAEEEQQRQLIEVASLAPVWASLYDDPALIEQFPYLPPLKESLAGSTPQPRSIAWTAISLAIQKNAYPALQGEVDIDAALKDMQRDLETAVATN